VIVDKASQRILATAFAKGRCHDFRLFKESRVYVHESTKLTTDTGYQGIKKMHKHSEHPKKRSKKTALTEQDKANNRQIAGDRMLNEHVIGRLKRFKILSERYRNRRKRFGLRFNLICALHNLEYAQIG
jgi:hypothetical protein